MAKATAVPEDPVGFDQVAFLLLPLKTFQLLTEEAGKRNQTLPQFICEAVDQYLVKTGGSTALSTKEK